MIVLKESNSSGRPRLDTTFGDDGFVVLSTDNTALMCGVTDATGADLPHPAARHTPGRSAPPPP